MSEAPPYSYWPAKCTRCGDETAIMRHRLFRGTDAGKCRLKTAKGVCRGKVMFLVAPGPKRMAKAKAVEIASDYDVHAELDRLAHALGRPDRES